MAGIKKIKIPPKIQIKDLFSNKDLDIDGVKIEIDFKSFVLKFLNLEHFQKNFELLCIAHAIHNSLKDSEIEEITLSSVDLKELENCMCENYHIFGLSPLGIIQLMPFFNAIIKAESI